MTAANENQKDTRIAELETRVRELVSEVEASHQETKNLAHTLRQVKAEKFRLQQQLMVELFH